MGTKFGLGPGELDSPQQLLPIYGEYQSKTGEIQIYPKNPDLVHGLAAFKFGSGAYNTPQKAIKFGLGFWN